MGLEPSTGSFSLMTGGQIAEMTPPDESVGYLKKLIKFGRVAYQQG